MPEMTSSSLSRSLRRLRMTSISRPDMLFSAWPSSPISSRGRCEMRSAYTPFSMRRAARVMRWIGRTSMRVSSSAMSTASSSETLTTMVSM